MHNAARDFTCLFVVLKTDNPDGKRVGYYKPLTKDVFLHIDTSSQGPPGELYSASGLIPQGDVRIETVNLMGDSWTVNYDTLTWFHYDDVPSIPGTVV
jgi:hypothetical protein